MSKLQLLLMGHFECLLPSGERISLSMRKAEVLLAYLALAPGIRHPRERLINLLWSDRGEEQARNSLRQCLSAIKKSLGEVADLVIQVDRTTVCLKPEMIDIDALEFERLATDAEFESLSDAAALYRGEFLEGISIRDAASQEWLDSERSRFKRQYIEILTNLGHTLLASHDHNGAIKISERLVAEDTLGESGWRLLMRAYSANGDRSHALQAFKRCQQALRSELEVEPEAATLELRKQIAASQMPAELTPARDIAPASIETEAPFATDNSATDNSATDNRETPADLTQASDHSIAVLPFDNLSGDPEQEYFSDGITDSIILNLSLFPDLQVKSRNSSFAFKQQIKSVGEISDELKVDYLVEGSIRRSQDRVRITVQLIDTTGGNQVWGKRYDADLENLFDLEEELSRTIAATVTGQIEADLQRIAIAKGAAGGQSYDLLLSGIYHSYRFSRRDNLIAIDKLNQCLVQDPDNVRAHVYLDVCHIMDYLGRWTVDYQASFELAKSHIERALQLAPELGVVQTFYAEFLLFSGKPDAASRHLDKALEINPNDTDALSTRAICLSIKGDFASSLQIAEQICRMDPYHPWAEWELAGGQYHSGAYEATLDTIASFRTEPGFTQIFAIASHVKLGHLDAARQALQNFLQASGEDMLAMPQSLDDWALYVRATYPFENVQYSQDLVDCLVQAGLEEFLGNSAKPDTETSHSIAVLPFDNLSGDPQQEYFSDGISESIILHLNMFPDLIVKSRNSSFAFKQQIKGLGEISDELGVDYLVEGSVRRSAEQIRITVQLVEAATGNQVWGKRYDAPLADLFNLEEDLSRSIAATVTGQIDADLQRIALTKGASEQQAYDLLLAGHYHLARFTPQDNAIAIEKFNLCLEQDPDNVRAQALLYASHGMDRLERWSSDYQLSSRRAQEHIDRAMELDPDLGMVQTFCAEQLVINGNFAQADKHLDKALAINPNDPEAFAVRAAGHISKGDFAAAMENATHAIELDPYHPWAEWELAAAQYFTESYETALETIAGARTSAGFEAIFAIAANIKLGRSDTARQLLQDFLRQCRETMLSMPGNLDEWYDYTRSYYLCADPSYNQDLIDCMVQAGLEDHLDSAEKQTQESSHTIAVLPFDNLSGDPEQEYFSDGITESIILHLNQFPDLAVKSRNSSFAFKQQIKSLGEISQELGVAYLVEGSIRKSTDKIRVTVQLVEAASGIQVWGKRYEAPLTDLFNLEEELSRSIAATVTGQIESDLQRVALAKGASDQQAYDLLLCGIYHDQRYTREDTVIAIEKLNLCLHKDAQNVMAHSWLYAAHLMNYLNRWTQDHRASFELAHQHVCKAMSLSPQNILVQMFYHQCMALRGDLDEATRNLRKMLSANPDNPNLLATLAFNLEQQGKADEALRLAERACELDPYHPWAEWEVAVSQCLSGQYEKVTQTIANMRTAPGFIQVFGIVANIKLEREAPARQMLQAMLKEFRETMLSMPQSIDDWLGYTLENYPFADPQINQDIVDCLVQAGLEDELAASAGSVEPSEYPSILVLPFGNLSGDTEQDYFSDGITESIIVTLSASSGLRVKSRHTSFAYRDSLLSLDQIGAKLEVQYIVEGSIRKHGEQVRITIQLSETSSGNQVWGKRYDRQLADLFVLEEELVQTIVGSISGRIGHNIKVSAKQRPASNPKSYDYLMRGWYHGERFTPEDNKTALENFSKCVELDPANAHALSLIAATLNVQRYENWCADHDVASTQAEQYINRALEFEPDNALAHSFMAEHLLFERKYEQALFHCERAIELEPGLPDGYGMKGYTLCLIGRIDEAVALAEQSLRIDPYHFYMGWNAGGVLRTAGAYQKAIDAYRKIPVPPPSLHAEIAACLVGLGEIPAARTAMTEYLRLCREQMPNYPTTEAAWRQVWVDSYNYQLDSDFEPFWKQLLTAGLCDNLELAFDAIPSVAVLPLQNLSSDAQQEYFSDGITSSLIMSLGLFNGLSVRSQNSSFALRNSEKSSKEIAQELAADFLIEGSIRKSGSKIRIVVQLVEAASDTQIWGKQYDAELVDILDLEQELSATIAATISGRIGHRIQQSAARKPANSLKSYDYLLRGLYHMGKFTAADMEIAQQQIEKCIALDPDNAEAHTQLGMVHTILRLENWTSDRQQTLQSEGKHLTRALELAPDNALVHAYYAEHLLSKRDYDLSEFHVNKAIELNPTAAEGYTVKADLMGFTRRYEEALNLADQCFRLDPNGVGTGWVAGDVYRITGQYEKAIRTLRSIPHPPATIHASIAASFVGLGQLDKAKAEMALFLKRARKEMPNMPESRVGWRKLYKQSSQYKYEEDFEELFSMLLQAGLCDEPAEGQDEIPSIAVLPFENMSGDAEQAFFSDGITTDIIATLSKFQHMRVISRHSIQQYKNREASITDIASEQSVRYILEGSVRKSTEKIRVNAELIDVHSEQNIWSERFDRELDDIFTIQDDITRNITVALKVALTDGERSASRTTGTNNVKAWELVLLATDLQDSYIQQNVIDARKMILQAIELDPKYAYARVALGWTHWQEAYSDWTDSLEQSLADAADAVEQSLQLEPDNAEAWILASTIHITKHESEKAVTASKRALEQEPGNAEIQALAGFAMNFIGDYEKATEHFNKALSLCPFCPNWYYLVGAQPHRDTGNLEKAAELLRRGIAAEPDSPLCRFYLADVLLEQGNETEAQQIATEIRKLDSSMNGRGLTRSHSNDASKRDRFLQNLEKLGLA